MPCLLDTGILLRVVNRQDALHEVTRLAVRMLKIRGDETVTTLQNISEFWNVCTRPPPLLAADRVSRLSRPSEDFHWWSASSASCRNPQGSTGSGEIR
jgi:hypothetical protein